MPELAIVIPAYKAAYLAQTLDALVRQTNQDFRVYIGDDASPEDIHGVVAGFHTSLAITYHRFDRHIGAENLVEQWDRCVGLTKGEDWFSLFGDDDLMDDNCVARFYDALTVTQRRFDVYRFNTVTINEEGIITNPGGASPEAESSAEMAYNLLRGDRGNSISDHIFSYSAYTRAGGFVHTPYAQGADWASSILFSQQTGVYTIPGAKVYWRYSASNISALAKRQKRMIEGHLAFASWTLNHFDYLKGSGSTVTYPMMQDAVRINMIMVLTYHYHGFNATQFIMLMRFFHKYLGYSYYGAAAQLRRINDWHLPLFRRFLHKARRVGALLYSNDHR